MEGERLQSLRQHIRAVCVHNQAQWDATWKEVLDDLSSTQQGLIPSTVFFNVLEANCVALNRAETRLLLYQFQVPTGAVAATKFLRWISLKAPADHMNPDLLFAQLPQPYRRIKKIIDQNVLNAAWELISTQSTRCQVENVSNRDAIGSSKSNQSVYDEKNDYDVATSRSCEPTWSFRLDKASNVVGLASHCLIPVVIVGISSESAEIIRIISTADDDVKVLGDFPLTFPVDAPTPADSTTTLTIKQLSTLQLTRDDSCCLAVHLVETSKPELANADVKLSVPQIRECVSIYSFTSDTSQPTALKFSCQFVAVVNPPLSVSCIVLSPDSNYLAVTSRSSTSIALYTLRRDETDQIKLEPFLLLSPTFHVDLEPTRSPFFNAKCDPTVQFLVAPAPSRPQTRRAPTAYALLVCYQFKVLKYLLPSTGGSTSSSSCVLLTPSKSWEHLTSITTSALDLTTQYLVVGCQDGSLVVWDVLQDVDYAFLAPLEDKTSDQKERPSGSSDEISNVIFCQEKYVVALSKLQQILYFFDVRDRGKPVLMRVKSLPAIPSTSTHQTCSQPAVSMINLVLSTATADIPVALVEYSSGMVIFFNVRTAEAIGSLQTTWTTPSSVMKQTATSSLAEYCWNITNIVGNLEALAVAGTTLNLYNWRDILPVLFPFFTEILEQHPEELKNSSIKQFFLSSEAVGGPPITALTTSVDLLEDMFLRMAEEFPSSVQRVKKFITSSPSPLQSPVVRSSTSFASIPTKELEPHQRAASAMLEPLVPDTKTFFALFCRDLDPLMIADKETKLHRKRRELLKIMSNGGAW